MPYVDLAKQALQEHSSLLTEELEENGLQRRGPPSRCDQSDQSAKSPPSWNQAEADRLLVELHAGLAQIEREHYDGRFPSVLRRAIDVCLEVVAAHFEARDVEQLSGDLPWLLGIARGDRWRGHAPPWRQGLGCSGAT